MELPTLPITSKKILVIEEDNENREYIARLLGFEGYFVVQVKEPINAYEVTKKFIPDLIISSIPTSAESGYDYYKAVRTEPALVTIPFIYMMQADASGQNLPEPELGIEDRIKKPIKRDELVKIVHARLLRAAQLEIAHMNRAYLETITVLANTIESRDHFTSEHVDRVAKIARILAEKLNFTGEELHQLEFGARLHDIGKITIPDHLLNKPGKLTPEEWALMKQHPVAGAKILSGISHLKGAIPYVLYHHERWDGSGYPMNLQGANIPIQGRIMALADVYDALVSERPYHPPRPQSEVIQFLKLRAGVHFDPELVPIFISILKYLS